MVKQLLMRAVVLKAIQWLSKLLVHQSMLAQKQSRCVLKKGELESVWFSFGFPLNNNPPFALKSLEKIKICPVVIDSL